MEGWRRCRSGSGCEKGRVGGSGGGVRVSVGVRIEVGEAGGVEADPGVCGDASEDADAVVGAVCFAAVDADVEDEVDEDEDASEDEDEETTLLQNATAAVAVLRLPVLLPGPKGLLRGRLSRREPMCEFLRAAHEKHVTKIETKHDKCQGRVSSVQKRRGEEKRVSS